jgi:hypothetical protein
MIGLSQAFFNKSVRMGKGDFQRRTPPTNARSRRPCASSRSLWTRRTGLLSRASMGIREERRLRLGLVMLSTVP